MAVSKIKENSVLLMQKEVAFDTYIETAQVAYPVEACTPSTDPTLESRANDDVGSIFGLTYLPTRLKHVLSISSKIYPDIFGNILVNLFGDPKTTADSPEEGANTHVGIINDDDADADFGTYFDNSLSAERVDFGLTADDYSGGKFNTFTISGGSSGYIIASVEGAAATRVSGTKPASWTITSEKPMRYFNASVSYGGSPIKVENWSISIDLQLLLENFKQSQTTEQAVPNGRPVVTASFEIFAADRTQRTSWEAGTATKQFKVTITWSDNIGETDTPYSLTLELPVTQVTQYTPPANDSGKGIESVSLEGFSGTTEGSNTSSFEYTLVDGNASY